MSHYLEYLRDIRPLRRSPGRAEAPLIKLRASPLSPWKPRHRGERWASRDPEVAHARKAAGRLNRSRRHARWSGSESLRSHILSCTDVERLDDWYRRAKTAASLADIFEPALLS